MFSEIDYEDLFSKALNISNLQEAPIELFEGMKEKKRSFLKLEKNKRKNLSYSFNGKRDISFDKLYRIFLQNNEGKEILKRLYSQVVKDKQYKEDFVSINLEKLPALRCIYKYAIASFYKQIVKNEKPKWGNVIDRLHAVYLGYCDVYISNDNDFLEIIRLFKEIGVKCLNLSEFIEQYIEINIY